MQRQIGNRSTLNLLQAQTVTVTRSASPTPTVRRLLDGPNRFGTKVAPALRGKGVGLISGKQSETLLRIQKLLGTARQDGLPETQLLAIYEEVADSCDAWVKVHGDEDHRQAVAPYLTQLANDARGEAAKLKQVDPSLKSTGYDKTKSKIVKKAQALDMKSALAKLGVLIDLAVPAPGSKGEVEFEVDIPIPKTPAFLGFRFKAEGDRPDPEKLKCRLELSFTGGVHIPGGMGRAAAELGGYTEAQGRTSDEVMRLFSYGLYRRARESYLSNAELTSLLWGGTTGDKGWKESERWAGAVEKHIFGENGDAYVQSGGFGRGVAEVGLDKVGKGKFDLQVGMGKHWDAAGIKAIADAKSTWSAAKIDAVADELLATKPTNVLHLRKAEQNLVDKGHIASADMLGKIVRDAGRINDGDPWDKTSLLQAIAPYSRAGQTRKGLNQPEDDPGFLQVLQSKAENVAYFKTSGQVTAGIFKGDGKVEGSWITRGRGSTIPTHFREGKIEVKGGFYLPASKLLGGGLAYAFQFEKLAASLAEMVKALPIKSAKMTDTQRAGSMSQPLSELTESALQTASVPKDQFSMALAQSDPLKQGVSVGSTIQLGLEVKVKARKKSTDPLPLEINLSVGEEQSLRAEAIVARAKVQTFNRWIRAQFKNVSGGEEWKFDVFGQQFDAKTSITG